MAASVIQVDYEALADSAQRFQQQQEEIEALQRMVWACLRPLESGGWQGRGAAVFFAEMNDEVLPGIGRLAESLGEAGTTIQKISDLFAAAEEEAAAQLDMGITTPTAPPGNSAADGSNLDPLSLFFESNRLFLDIVMAMSNNRGATRELFREFGRILNDLTGQRGHVGLLDDLYKSLIVDGLPYGGDFSKLLKSRWFESGLVGADALFGFFDDLYKGTYGDDYLQAAGVNTIDSLIQYAISANPYGAAALVVNGIVQIGGNIQLGVQNTLIDMFAVDSEMAALLHRDTSTLNTALDKMNLGNITKELGEAIYTTGRDRLNLYFEGSKISFNGMLELAQDPSWETLMRVSDASRDYAWEHKGEYLTMALCPLAPSAEGVKNLKEAGIATLNVVDGIVDWNIASATNKANWGMNILAQSANMSPYVPDSMKANITQAAKESAQMGQEATDWLVGLINL